MTKKLERPKVTKLVFLLIGACVVLRCVPHPWNVTPLVAVLLFSGAHLNNRVGLGVLFGSLFVSDLLIGWHATVMFTWGAFFLILIMGKFLRSRVSWGALFGCSVASSTLFYIISNLGVFLTGTLYERSLAGLISCYAMAIPFYRNALIGDLVYTFILFGVYHIACARLLTPKTVKAVS